METEPNPENPISVLEKLEIKPGGVLDVRDKSQQEVFAILRTLEESDLFVFHGGGDSEEPIEELRPMLAEDTYSNDNSIKAVFATERLDESLAYALFSRKKIRERWDSFTTGIGFSSEKGLLVHLNPEVYEEFIVNPGGFFDDAYLYVMARLDFEILNRDNGGSEYTAFEAQKPLVTFHLSGSLGEEIFITNKSVFPYSKEEINEKRIPPARRRQFL